MDIKSLLNTVVEHKASDLMIVAGSAPMLSAGGRIEPAGDRPVSAQEAMDMVFSLLTKEQKDRFEKEKELDSSYDHEGVARFRVNVHYQKGTVAASLRSIPSSVPSVGTLGLPKVVDDFVNEPRGLILVTGPTGAGKTTTQAAMLDTINSTKNLHIITIEDPIEFLHKSKKSLVEQREVGIDTDSFPSALRRVLRQNPDVILIGEMRELETISTAITAAETGHLVISTLHTNDSVQSIDRMIDVFPPHQQNQVRMQLSLTLQGVISQQLIPRSDGQGLVLASEILRINSGIRNIIRKGATTEIYSMIEIGRKYGMQSMDSSLKDLYQAGKITYDSAIARAINPENLEKMLTK